MNKNQIARTQQARRRLQELRLDALAVAHLPNILYLSGFSGSNALLLLLPDRLHLFTDSRYSLQARQESAGASVHIVRGPLIESLGAFLRLRRKGRALRIGFDPSRTTLGEWQRLRKMGPAIRWKPTPGLIEGLREVKGPDEIEIMRQSARLGSEVMAEVLSQVRPGITELDLAAEADYRMRRKGASGPSFDTIVASGERTALPHAHPTEKRLRKNELVLIDLGAILRHYCSDLTRTVYLGRAPTEVRAWYKAVEQAQQAALETIQAGVAAESIDCAARRVLDRRRLGRYFVHATGHGVGLEIHESPRLGRGQSQPLRESSIITLEPGVYVKGKGGIRIEDEVMVHSEGAEVLTSAPRGLLEL